jgi:hypothetical protein
MSAMPFQNGTNQNATVPTPSAMPVRNYAVHYGTYPFCQTMSYSLRNGTIQDVPRLPSLARL